MICHILDPVTRQSYTRDPRQVTHNAEGYLNASGIADTVAIMKYVVKNVARAHGKVTTFMPKPLFADNGTGMHTHQSLWKEGTNLFYDANGSAMLSATCRHYNDVDDLRLRPHPIEFFKYFDARSRMVQSAYST